MDNLRRYLVPILILSGLIALAIGFRSVAAMVLLEPIAVLAWAAWRILLSVDQDVYWLAVLLTCSIGVISLLPDRNRASSQPAYAREFLPPTDLDRWRQRLEDALLRSGHPEPLRLSLKDLAVLLFADTRGRSSPQLESDVRSRPEDFPAGVRLLFHAPERGVGKPGSAARQSAAWFRRHWAEWSGVAGARLNLDAIDELLSWLETQAKVNHVQEY